MPDRRRLLAIGIAALSLAPAAALAEGKKDKKEGVSSDPFIALPSLSAPVIRTDGRRGVLTVQAVLYGPVEAQRLKATQSIPRLVDAYVQALQAWTYRLPPGTLPNVDRLADVLQQETDRLLGKGVRLLIGGVLVG